MGNTRQATQTEEPSGCASIDGVGDPIYQKGRHIALIIGGAETESAIRDLQGVNTDVRPLAAWLLSPSEVLSLGDLPKNWKHLSRRYVFVAGDAIDTSRNIYVWGNLDLAPTDIDFAHYSPPTLRSMCTSMDININDVVPGNLRIFDSIS